MSNTPTPMQPVAATLSPKQLYDVNTGRSAAKRNYLQTTATNQFNRNQTNLGYNANVRNMDWQQGMQRQNFDDPYIGRGMFNSGVRQQGLSDFYTGWNNQRGDAEREYLKMIGGYDLSDTFAGQEQQDALSNYDLYEQAMRADKAAEIKGII
jgi:hypothetical protein